MLVRGGEHGGGALWRIPVLGLGAFGAQVLTALASTRQTTALEWLPFTMVPWTVRAGEPVFVVADWREAAHARHAAHLAGTCRTHGCLTIAIGPSPAAVRAHPGPRRRRRDSRLVRPWVDCLVTSPPARDHQTGPCRPGWHAARTQAPTWAAQVIDGMADFLRADMLCVDLTDLQVLFTRSGRAMGGSGCASGPDRTPTALHRSAGRSLARCHDAGPGPAGADHGDGEPGSDLVRHP